MVRSRGSRGKFDRTGTGAVFDQMLKFQRGNLKDRLAGSSTKVEQGRISAKFAQEIDFERSR